MVRGIVHFGAVVVVSAGTEDEILQELSAVGDDADVSAATGPTAPGVPAELEPAGIPLSLRHHVSKQECTILAQVPWPSNTRLMHLQEALRAVACPAADVVARSMFRLSTTSIRAWKNQTTGGKTQ